MMIASLTRRSPLVLALALAALVAPACGGDTSGGGGEGGNAAVAPVIKTIAAAQGGTIADPAGHGSLTIPADSLAKDTEITLTITAKRSDTVTSVYAFAPAGLVLSKPATLAISTDGVTVPAEQKAVLAVMSDDGWTELPGSTEGSGGLQAPLTTLATFSAVLVAAPAGPCDATCMAQAGAVCCTTCGCEAAACKPTCPTETPWDCEIQCCYDYQAHVCAP